MFDQNEEVEILVENELSPKAQETSSETNIKQKDKQEKKKGIFKSEWLREFKFLKEYKPDKTQATCMACNSEFSVHYGGNNDVVQHSKTKQHSRNMLTFSIDRELITIAIIGGGASEAQRLNLT